VNLLAEQIIANVIANQLALDSDRVLVRDQSFKLKPDDGLYVIVGMVGEQALSVVNSTETGTTYIKEIQQVVTQEMVQIDILSRSNEAILRRWEIFAALSSVYCQQKQEENAFKIFKIPSSFINTSGTEGGSNLNKFSITVACHVWYRKENTLGTGDYYDDFNTRVDDEKTIGTAHGAIEFEIKGDSILGGNS